MSYTITLDLVSYRATYGVRQVRPMAHRVSNARGFALDAAGMDDGSGLVFPMPLEDAGHARRPLPREHRRLARVLVHRYGRAREDIATGAIVDQVRRWDALCSADEWRRDMLARAEYNRKR